MMRLLVVATTIRPHLLSESSTSSSEVRLALGAMAPGKLSEVVGDHGTLRMEPLQVGGERRGIRRASPRRELWRRPRRGVTADCPGSGRR